MKADKRIVEMRLRREYWRQIFAERECSGCSALAYCRERLVKEQLF